MLIQDTRAFVEILEVPRKDKRAEKRRRRAREAQVDALRARLDVRLFEAALGAMERAAAVVSDERPDDVLTLRRPIAPSERQLKSVQAGLERARATAQRKTALAHALEREVEERDLHPRVTRWYRLHTEFRHFEWSEQKFAGLAGPQRSRPVRLAVSGNVRWWWFRDRFWCEDEGLRSDQVAALVLESDRGRMRRRRVQEQALVDALTYDPAAEVESNRREPVARPTSGGTEGSCVDCGSLVDVVFDAVSPAHRGGNGVASLAVELRCVSCREQRQAAEARERMRQARESRPTLPWRHDELLAEAPPAVEDEAQADDRETVSTGGLLPVVWVVSPEDVHARHA